MTSPRSTLSKHERNAEILRQRAGGMKYQAIADRHGVSIPRVYEIVRRETERAQNTSH
jgi:DNA-binding CsgD family transcriptional regulator